MRKLNEFVYRLRWGPLEERRRHGLFKLHDVLAETSFAGRYWMIMGLLLGCMRDGGPIRWDRDSDFGFMEEDLPHLLAATKKLHEHGYVMRRPQVNNDGRTTKWAWKFQAVKYEFFQFEKHGGNIRWYYHRRKPAMELVNEVPAHGLSSFELYGRRWLMPDKADEILTRIYGNWRKPDPNYVYWRDCGATIDRYPWTGERRPPD
ncbi:MAG: LicD family protein [Steroidobacteraceae bacterium]